MTNEEMFNQYAATRSIDARNKIVEAYLYMVDVLIRKYLNKGVDYDDLYQVGALALVSAVERFDIDRGFEFTSFATPTILGEIKKHFRDKEWAVKVPRRLKEVAVKIPAAKEELFHKLFRAPTIPELAECLGYSEEEILEAMESSRAYGTYSLDQTFEDDGEEGSGPIFEKYAITEEAGYDRFEYAEVINAVLDKLSDEHKKIFRLRFLENKTQGEIAEEIGVSQMTVSRAEKIIKNKFQEEIQR